MNAGDLDRLRAMTVAPERTAMSRAQQFPSMAAQHIADEQEVVRLRAALAEGVGEIDRLTKALRWLARNDANGWVKQKVEEVLG